MKLQDKRNSDCYVEVLLNSFKNFQSSPSQIFYKMVFLVISQNSQENMCATVFFDNVIGFQPPNISKYRLRHSYFPVIFTILSRAALL